MTNCYEKNTFRILCFIAVFISLNSCTSYYYVPNSHNVPLFQNEKEAIVNIAGSSGENFGGAELQVAYAFTKNFGFMVNGFFNSQGYYSGGGFFVEAGTGYFKSLHRNIVFETFVGIGIGEITFKNALGKKSTLNYTRYFIQPAIGYTLDYFDIAVSSRFCGLGFHNINDVLPPEDEILSTSSFLIEPALTIRAGWNLVKIRCQIGYSVNLNNTDLIQENLNLSFGVCFVIPSKDMWRNSIYK